MIRERLRELGLTLPNLPQSVANYRGFAVHKGVVYVSGQLPTQDGKVIYTGQVATELTVEEAYQAAQLCCLNILAQVDAAVEGNWGVVEGCLRIGGFVQAAPGFTQHPQVINGASDLLGTVLGEAGRHARAAVGVSSLPLNAAVEVEATWALV